VYANYHTLTTEKSFGQVLAVIFKRNELKTMLGDESVEKSRDTDEVELMRSGNKYRGLCRGSSGIIHKSSVLLYILGASGTRERKGSRPKLVVDRSFCSLTTTDAVATINDRISHDGFLVKVV